MTPAAKIAALNAEISDTREAAAVMLRDFAVASVAKTQEEREALAVMYEGIADGHHRSRVTAGLCRLVAEKLRAE